jgi:hypothetical protein
MSAIATTGTTVSIADQAERAMRTIVTGALEELAAELG